MVMACMVQRTAAIQPDRGANHDFL